jgi:Flp pilus assembly protein TadB
MSSALVSTLFFSLIGGLGVWLFYSTLTGQWEVRAPAADAGQEFSLTRGKQKAACVTALRGLPLAQRVLAQPLTDLGFILFGQQDQEALTDRLRRSGWRFLDAGDYYASRVATALIYLSLGVFIGVAANGPIQVTALLAGGLGFLGLSMPATEVRVTTRLRRDSLLREMAWTLDKVALVMQSGDSLSQALQRLTDNELAWLAGGGGGLFTGVLRDVSNGMVMHPHDTHRMLEEVKADLPPNLPELDEFLQAVEVHITQGKDISGQLFAMAKSLREQLNLRIKQAAQNAQTQVMLLGAVNLLIAIVVTVGPPFLAFLKEFASLQ